MHTEKMLPLFPSPPVGGRIALAKKQLNPTPLKICNFPWHKGINGKLFIEAFTWAAYTEAVWAQSLSGCHR